MTDFLGFLTRFCVSGLIPRCSRTRKFVLLKVNILKFALQDQNQVFSTDKLKFINQ